MFNGIRRSLARWWLRRKLLKAGLPRTEIDKLIEYALDEYERR
jgi:hypothetical protein